MDPTASADDAAPATRSNFNIFRDLMIMLLLFIVLYFGIQNISDQDQNPKNSSLPKSELLQTIESNTPKQITNLPVNNDDGKNIKPGKIFQQNLNKAITNKENKSVQNNTSPRLSHTNNHSILSQLITPLINTTRLKSRVELPKIASYDWSSISTQSPPIDSALLQRLSEQLNDYQNHFQPEKVYLQFDRTFFKPGESIWFSAYLRDANTLKASAKSDLIYVELNAPNGGNLKTLTLVAEHGRVRGDFQLNENMPGGLYTVSYTHLTLPTKA